MEYKCFQEGCEEEAFLICRCTKTYTKACKLHLFDHMMNNSTLNHKPVPLRFSVDPDDSNKVINTLEAYKRNIYNSMKNLARVAKQLYLCIEAEIAKEMKELKKREKEIEDLIDTLSELTYLRIDQDSTNLCDLFCEDNARRSKALSKYEGLSKVLNLSNLNSSCQELLSKNTCLNRFLEETEDNKVYYFSDCSSNLITYDLSTMQETEMFVEGSLRAIIKCILPGRKLLCLNYEGNVYFTVDLDSGAVIDLGSPQLYGHENSLVYGNFVYFSSSQNYSVLDLRRMKWSSEHPEAFNLRGFFQAAKFEGKIYGIYSNSPYVYVYWIDSRKFMKAFEINGNPGILFECRKKLFLLGINLVLHCMESGSNKFVEVKTYKTPMFNSVVDYTKEVTNSLCFYLSNKSIVRFDPETYEFTTIQLNQART